MNNEQFIRQFVEGKDSGKNQHIFIEHNVLYDYGYHFPMLLRLKDGFILNKTKYSRTTSKHQNYCRKIANNVKEMGLIDIQILLGENTFQNMSMEELNKTLMLEVMENEY